MLRDLVKMWRMEKVIPPPPFSLPISHFLHMQCDFFFSGKKKRERSMSQLSPPFLPPMDDDGNVPEEKQRESGIDIFLLHLSKAEKSHLSLYGKKERRKYHFPPKYLWKCAFFRANEPFSSFPFSRIWDAIILQ